MALGPWAMGPGPGAENIDFPYVFKGLEPETMIFFRFFNIWAEVAITKNAF